jgi:photosystem II CP47 chlorophyll apoprotein
MSERSNNIRLPWFRVHIVILNDPGRLIGVHIAHTSLISGRASSMIIYELVLVDPTDQLFDPIRRQGMYVLEFATRIGVVGSAYNRNIGVDDSSNNLYWTYETVGISHLILSGTLMLAAIWHWSYRDLELFINSTSGTLILDFVKIFGIHLLISSLLCYGYGYYHTSGLLGPGVRSSDSYGLVGSIRSIKPVFSTLALTTTRYNIISAHHISAGTLNFKNKYLPHINTTTITFV